MNLGKDDVEIAMDFINKHAKSLGLDTSKIANDIAQYIGKCSIWSSQEIWDAAKTLDPVTWWKGFCSMRELTKLAIIYLNFPCTSAACERNWKDFSNIKTKHRNLLTNTRTIKLVSVKYNLSLLAPDPSKNKKQFIEEEEFEPITLIDADDEDSDDEADDYGDCPSFDELF
ncbi:uncharacterized protein LOC122853818 [Aphidius gifuensis]|uniref:uncharacterized protein LOC122853818 n=1 Tax=Aphidius gifuensis TaxID=684658 RepID=UPI001CDC6B54|nr:uncharacterized protein LOC122853818 [Aphidius gifuensis]